MIKELFAQITEINTELTGLYAQKTSFYGKPWNDTDRLELSEIKSRITFLKFRKDGIKKKIDGLKTGDLKISIGEIPVKGFATPVKKEKQVIISAFMRDNYRNQIGRLSARGILDLVKNVTGENINCNIKSKATIQKRALQLIG